jgi:hypothetical protein
MSSVRTAHIACYWKFFPVHCKYSVSTGFAKQTMPILRFLRYNGSLITSTVLSQTTAKFKPLTFSVSLRLILYCEYVHSHYSLTFAFCLQFCYTACYSHQSQRYCHVHVWLYRRGFGLDDGIYCTLYIHTVRDYMQYSAITILYTFQFTVAHALGVSLFTSSVQATDLSQSHCYFKSHSKSFLHRPGIFSAEPLWS